MKFIGKFKDLKPMGFTFHKLFARNYKVYEKNKIWIWVAQGGYIEFDDLYEMSKYVIQAVLNKTYPEYKEDKYYKDMLFYKKGDYMPCKFNKKTGEIVPIYLFYKKYGHEYDYDTWRDLHISESTRKTIFEIKDMIEI